MRVSASDQSYGDLLFATTGPGLSSGRLLVREGCVGETVASLEAAECEASAEDPAIRAVLATIAADPRGPQVYYGMRSETDRDGTKLEARLRR